MAPTRASRVLTVGDSGEIAVAADFWTLTFVLLFTNKKTPIKKTNKNNVL